MKSNFSLFKATTSTLLGLACLGSGLGLNAQAAVTTQAELRVFGLETSYGNGVGFLGRDYFNNGTPLSGMGYRAKTSGNPTGPVVTGGYNSQIGSFTAGAELTGPAPGPLGTAGGIGLGGLSFRVQDAVVSNNNLTPAGYNGKGLSLDVNFMDPRATNPVPGANFQGLVQTRDGFDIFSAWDVIAPSAGASYGIRAQGSGVAGTLIFNDQINLRVVTSLLGDVSVNLERVSRDVSGTLFRQVLGSVPFSAAYSGPIANADLLVLDLFRAQPTTAGSASTNPAIQASFTLIDIGAGGAFSNLGRYDFATQPQIFNDGSFMFASARATWLESTTPPNDVPEPSSLALLALGLLVAGIAARRN